MRSSLFVSMFAMWLALGCGHNVPLTPRQRVNAAVAAKAERPRPSAIEIRLLEVTYTAAPTGKAEERTKEQALERASMLARMARSGDRFAELVRNYSDRPGASEDFGLFRVKPDAPGVLGSVVVEAALALDPGRIGDPVEALSGYVVIERRADPDSGPTSVGARHILVSYKGAAQAIPGVTRSETEARTLAEQIVRRAKAGEDWNKLAEQYTDEPGSKQTGGDLGRFGHGQMVPSFEKAAFALEVGAISDVVPSPFGFHVIQRYE